MLSIFKQQGKEQLKQRIPILAAGQSAKRMLQSWIQCSKAKLHSQQSVEAGIVEKPEEYVYSSARAYHQHKSNGLLEIEFL